MDTEFDVLIVGEGQGDMLLQSGRRNWVSGPRWLNENRLAEFVLTGDVYQQKRYYMERIQPGL